MRCSCGGAKETQAQFCNGCHFGSGCFARRRAPTFGQVETLAAGGCLAPYLAQQHARTFFAAVETAPNASQPQFDGTRSTPSSSAASWRTVSCVCAAPNA